MLFNKSTNIYHYIIAFIVLFVVSTFIRKKILSKPNNNENDAIIRDYLLNESPLYGYNRPKIWIHSTYTINARKWKDFYSRNTTDLNQPYIHLTIKSVINHCGDDFNVCLIDDESFSNLLPDWNIKIENLAEPTRSQYRELGILKLLNIYGGLVIPNSFICIKNLKTFYEEGVQENNPFVCETVNNISTNPSLFIPTTNIMGSLKNNETIIEMIESVDQILTSIHNTTMNEFTEKVSNICIQNIQNKKMNIINGEKIGIKTTKGKPILVDHLMNESDVDIAPGIVGLYIPSEEVLKRTKYQWFASLTAEQVLESKTVVSKYLTTTLIDSANEYSKSSIIKSVVCI